MSNSFTQGTMGIPDGTALNSAGLMLHSVSKGAASQPRAQIQCQPGQVQWHSDAQCFTPGQVHINALALSVVANVALLLVLLLLLSNKNDYR